MLVNCIQAFNFLTQSVMFDFSINRSLEIRRMALLISVSSVFVYFCLSMSSRRKTNLIHMELHRFFWKKKCDDIDADEPICCIKLKKKQFSKFHTFHKNFPSNKSQCSYFLLIFYSRFVQILHVLENVYRTVCPLIPLLNLSKLFFSVFLPKFIPQQTIIDCINVFIRFVLLIKSLALYSTLKCFFFPLNPSFAIKMHSTKRNNNKNARKNVFVKSNCSNLVDDIAHMWVVLIRNSLIWRQQKKPEAKRSSTVWSARRVRSYWQS